MSGRALIIVVTGIIITTSILLYNISASSNNIVANFNSYFLRQSAQNMAQSGVNMALRKLTVDRTYRAGFPLTSLFGGKVRVDMWNTKFNGIDSAIAIRSIGYAEYNTTLQRVDTTIAYAFYPPIIVPTVVKSLLTMNGTTTGTGNIVLDAREHDLQGNVIASTGTNAIWSTGNFTPSGSLTWGGTGAGIDYPVHTPTPLLDTGFVKTGQPYPGGFPSSPDSALGGPRSGFSEGTLMAVAKSGINGSQYVTDPSKLIFPLSGVTYVEMPTNSPKNTWSSAKIRGSGILVVHNSANNATADNLETPPGEIFRGIVVADDLKNMHLDILGAVVSMTKNPSASIIGNGNARLLYSGQAVKNAVSFLANGSEMHVLGWWE